MNYFLVDYENVKTDGLNGVANLSQGDVVCIFYSENANNLTFGLHRRLTESMAEITYKKVDVSGKNALDFQLSTFLGYIICENSDSQYHYYIVSKDKGFESVVKFWEKKADVSLVINVAKENANDLELEIAKLIGSKEDAATVAKIIRNYKTKSGINNALMKAFPSSNHKKSSQIYSAIKPLIADKKGS